VFYIRVLNLNLPVSVVLNKNLMEEKAALSSYPFKSVLSTITA
jgi:hypothetical protein